MGQMWEVHKPKEAPDPVVCFKLNKEILTLNVNNDFKTCNRNKVYTYLIYNSLKYIMDTTLKK